MRLIRQGMILLALVGCTKKCSEDRNAMSPESVLETYLETAFNIKEVEQKKILLKYTTGALKAAISGASDDAIRSAYINPRYHLEKYSLLEKTEFTPRECKVTYQITYHELPEGSSDETRSALITTENSIHMIKEKGGWMISEVLGNKMNIEFPIMNITKEKEVPALPLIQK